MSSNNLFCLIDKSPSFVNSKEAANKPAVPDLLWSFSYKKLFGSKSVRFFQFSSLPKKDLILFIPSSSIWDGQFANNGWLQELPDTIRGKGGFGSTGR